MRYRKSILFVLAGMALMAPAGAGASQLRGVSEFHVVSGAAVPGADTGFTVKPGAPVTVRAFGAVCAAGGTCPGPDGDASIDTLSGSFLLPGAPAWGLVARVGDGPWTQVGSGPTEVSGSGDLVFAVNDDSVLTGNTGGFVVVFSYQCYPGNGKSDQNHYHCGPPGKL